MSPRLELQLDRERYAPGEAMNGTIFVVEGGDSRALEALLEYKEKTDDYQEVANSISAASFTPENSHRARRSSSSCCFRRTPSRTTSPSTASSTGSST